MGLMDYVNNTHHQSDALVRLSPDQIREAHTSDRTIQLFNGTERVLDEKIVGPRDMAVTWSDVPETRVTHAVITLDDGKQQRYEIGPLRFQEHDDFTLNLR